MTGFESFYISGDLANPGILDEAGPWCACAGTKGRWDELTIEADEMRAVRVWAKGRV